MHRSLLVLGVLLAGCAANPGTNSVIQPPAEPSCIILTSRISFYEVRGVGKNKWEEGLLSGVYQAISTDSEGTYYEGAGRPFYWLNSGWRNQVYQVRRGGVWIPKYPGRKANLYFIDEPKIYTAANLDEYEKSGESAGEVPPVAPGVAGAGALGVVVSSVLGNLSNGKRVLWGDIKDDQFIEALHGSLKVGAEASACNRAL